MGPFTGTRSLVMRFSSTNLKAYESALDVVDARRGDALYEVVPVIPKQVHEGIDSVSLTRNICQGEAR